MKFLFRSLLVLCFLMSVSCSKDELVDTDNQLNQLENELTEKKTNELLQLLEEIDKTKKITNDQKKLYKSLILDDKITISIRSNSELAKIMKENNLDFSEQGNAKSLKSISFTKNDCDFGNLRLRRTQEETFYGEFLAEANVRWSRFSESAEFEITFGLGVETYNISPFVAIVNTGIRTEYRTNATVVMRRASTGDTRTFRYRFVARVEKCNGAGFLNVEG